jgi:DNA-binding transcriptional LysR family regulator
MFDLGQLRCFVAVASELNFRRAAVLLNMTQPPLSRQIQLLEHSLGVRLLDRTRHSVSLTTGGQVFLVDARRLLNLAEQAANTVRRACKGETGRVRIGFTGAAGYEIVPRLLAAAKQALPDIDVIVHELVSAAQIEAFAANSIDLGILRPLVSRQQLDSFLVEREPMVAALPAGHPLAAGDEIDLPSLNGLPFIMHSPKDGKYFHDRIMGLLLSSGVRPDFIQYIDQTHTIISLVRAGLGVAIVPRSAQRFHFDKVVYRPLRCQAVLAEMVMAWRPDQCIPAVTALRLMAEDYFSRPEEA